MELKDLVQNEAKCDELLNALDAVAAGVDSYEYGLPMYDDGAKARLREALYRWACGDENPSRIEREPDGVIHFPLWGEPLVTCTLPPLPTPCDAPFWFVRSNL